jgi:hypothetical protein
VKRFSGAPLQGRVHWIVSSSAKFHPNTLLLSNVILLSASGVNIMAPTNLFPSDG